MHALHVCMLPWADIWGPSAQSYAAITEAMLDGREADGADAEADADADGDVVMDDARDGDDAAGQAGGERGGDGGAEEGAADGRGNEAPDGGGPGGARGGSPREGSADVFGGAGSVLGVVVPRQLRTAQREPRQPQARRAAALRSRPCAARGRRRRVRSAEPALQVAGHDVHASEAAPPPPPPPAGWRNCRYAGRHGTGCPCPAACFSKC